MNLSRVNPLDPLNKVSSSEHNKIKRIDVSCDGNGSIVLSGQAREASIVKMAVGIANAAPEIRFDKVEMARKNINDPAYLESIMEKTAEKIMLAFGIEAIL